MFGIGLLFLSQTVRIIAAHVFVLFRDEVLCDHHILGPAPDLPFSQASLSNENLPIGEPRTLTIEFHVLASVRKHRVMSCALRARSGGDAVR